MADLILHKKNEAYIQFECDRGIAQELSDYFTFFVPGHQFTPAYKSRIWDGKIRLADLRSFTIYHGLVPYIEIFCKERDYTLEIDSDVNSTENYSVVEAKEFISTLNIPLEVRDYQLKSFVHAVRNKRILLLSPTASGKSLIIYLILRHLQLENKKGLLIAPTTSLVEQMYKDFEDYGYDSEQYCHRQYSGKEKHTNKFLSISTWQSIYKQPSEYFEQFDFVFGDECLHPDTLINMSDGTKKKIKDIIVGDLVATFNEVTQTIESKPVVQLYQNLSFNEQMYEIELANKSVVKITGNHKVLLISGVWKRVDELEIGDIINRVE
jgi:reverse gyrase